MPSQRTCKWHTFRMSTLERAIALAAHSHSGQFDKAGAPYILHPLRVMLAMGSEPERGQHRIAAVLHDVVEDTPLTFDDLRREGFSDAVLSAIQALTKTNGEGRISAAHRAAADPIARMVKWADVSDNMDLSRIKNPSEKDHARLIEYAQVKTILQAAIDEAKR